VLELLHSLEVESEPSLALAQVSAFLQPLELESALALALAK
jgi:hypothetical protein